MINRVSVLAFLAYSLLCSGCLHDVPITDRPTRQINEQLLGDWMARNEENGETVRMKVAKLDDYKYVVYFDHNLYRAYHSDVATVPFVTVQDLDTKEQKYSYSMWELKADGSLIGRSVNEKVVPDETRNSAAVRELLKKNIANPNLFNKPMKFTREKKGLGG
jgi:hypothetical protein